MNPVEHIIHEDNKKPRRILVVGDGMMDVYVHGKLSKCQDGCDKITEENYVEVGGGACNAARSLMHWRARKVCLFVPGVSTKTRFMVDGKVHLRYDDERYDVNYNPLRDEVLECIREWKPEGILLSDYDKGVFCRDFVRKIVAECKRSKVPCVADAKLHPDYYSGTVIKGNEVWFEKFRTDMIHSKDKIVVTMGADEPNIWDDGWRPYHNDKLPTVKCVNHVGAGDCFAAHLTLALACGLSLKDAAAAAHSAGRVYVQRQHNSPPHPQDILRDATSMVTP